MGGRKVTIVFDEGIFEQLENRAKESGMRPSGVVRYLTLKAVQDEKEPKDDYTVLQVPIDNYTELSEFVKNKKFGSISNLATFAMQQYMSKFPIKPTQNERVEKSIE